MSNKLYRTALIVALLSCKLASAQSIINDSVSAQLKAGVKGFQQRYHSPSVVLMVVHKDRVIFSDTAGYTDLENKIPATVNSKYQIQSITKMFTSTLAMNLWERGVVKLDGNIRQFVPEFTGANRDGTVNTTTFLELATHTSGLPRNSQADIGFANQVEAWLLTKKERKAIRAATMNEFLKSLPATTKEYPDYEFLPKDNRQYSNMGYALLGLALARAAGVGFQDAVRKKVLEPLNLNNTGFGTVSNLNNVIATGYYYDNETKTFLKTPDFYANAADPAAGMYSTGTDMAKFISAQFTDKNKVISKKTIRMMQSLGIGWQRSYPYVKHEGAMLGSRSEVVIHPKLEVGWVILTNTTDFEFDRFNAYIASLVLPLFIEKPVTDMNEYVGIYALEGGGESIRVYIKDGKLYSTYFEHILPHEPLFFAGDNALKAKGLNGHDISFNFLTDHNGKISVLNLNQLMWIKKQ